MTSLAMDMLWDQMRCEDVWSVGKSERIADRELTSLHARLINAVEEA